MNKLVEKVMDKLFDMDPMKLLRNYLALAVALVNSTFIYIAINLLDTNIGSVNNLFVSVLFFGLFGLMIYIAMKKTDGWIFISTIFLLAWAIHISISFQIIVYIFITGIFFQTLYFLGNSLEENNKKTKVKK